MAEADFEAKVERLAECLNKIAPLTIAVSGGVDSMTLASFAHRRLGRQSVRMAHASSPAVPTGASGRIDILARQENWQLDIVDAAELADPNYRSNPVNRCFFCKSNLYSRLNRLAPGAIASGANCDDLTDYRPGLKAADNYAVHHPYIETGFTKRDVRRLASLLGHQELADLPSSPCLSSRIETGIAIEVGDLYLIDRVETWLRERLGAQTVRCRIRKTGIVVELDEAALNDARSSGEADLLQSLAASIPELNAATTRITSYRQGSAFVGVHKSPETASIPSRKSLL